MQRPGELRKRLGELRGSSRRANVRLNNCSNFSSHSNYTNQSPRVNKRTVRPLSPTICLARQLKSLTRSIWMTEFRETYKIPARSLAKGAISQQNLDSRSTTFELQSVRNQTRSQITRKSRKPPKLFRNQAWLKTKGPESDPKLTKSDLAVTKELLTCDIWKLRTSSSNKDEIIRNRRSSNLNRGGKRTLTRYTVPSTGTSNNC